MRYIFMPELSHKSGVPSCELNALCSKQKIEGAVRCGGIWAVPERTVINVASILAKSRM